ncbi:MAG: hypothetical protein GY861_15790 [bacterium]|nr:hypothetical protein [bacterium]
MKGKKGMFFTFMAVLIVSALLFSFAPQSYVSVKQKTGVIQARVDSSNNYVENVKGVYLERALRVASHNAIKSLVWRVNYSGYIPEANVQRNFSELVLRGTMDGVSVDSSGGCEACIAKDFMIDSNLTYSLEKIENASRDFLKIETVFEKDTIKIELFQDNTTGPWQVGARMYINYTIEAGLANWTITRQNLSTRFSIEGLHNPLILRSRTLQGGATGGWHDASNVSKIVVSNLTEYEYDKMSSILELGNMTYMFRYDVAPSFLQRLSPLVVPFEPSECCGMEVLINPNKLGYNSVALTASYGYRDKSYVDWCMYTLLCPPDDPIPTAVHQFYNVSGVSTCREQDNFFAFKLDANTLAYYGWENNGTQNATQRQPCD